MAWTELEAILNRIRANSGCEAHWLDLAGWFCDNGRDDEAAAMRIYWPVLRDSISPRVTLDETIAFVVRHAGQIGRTARDVEEQGLRR